MVHYARPNKHYWSLKVSRKRPFMRQLFLNLSFPRHGIMKLMFLIIIFALFPIITSSQVKIEDNKKPVRYSNELKGFKLMKTSKLRALVPGVSTAKEIRIFIDECKSPYNELTTACQLDNDWDVGFTQIDNLEGNLSSIKFYPRKRIPFSKVKFSKKFKKYKMGIVHSINASRFIAYSDKYGLTYVIVAESGDYKYRKGDLFYIEYGLSEDEIED